MITPTKRCNGVLKWLVDQPSQTARRLCDERCAASESLGCGVLRFCSACLCGDVTNEGAGGGAKRRCKERPKSRRKILRPTRTCPRGKPDRIRGDRARAGVRVESATPPLDSRAQC